MTPIRDPKSATLAKERLKLVLIHDRTELTGKSLENLKNDLFEVLNRYVEIDPANVEINIQHEGREQTLVANIPIRGSKPRRK